jgi:PBP1b-binding outer membrane lipoprotein LpoB
MRLRCIAAILSAMLLVSCENTNVLVMTEAATDAVTAITLTDEDVQSIGQRTAQVSDGKYKVATPEILMTDACNNLWQAITRGMGIPSISKCI